jgi:hypothetical protein
MPRAFSDEGETGSSQNMRQNDETFDEAARIDALLRSDKVQRDLESEPDSED